MKRKVLGIIFLWAMVSACLSVHQVFADYDYGDNRSVTLVSNAWAALGQNDLPAVLAYTNKCIELYSDKAKEMQANLKGYPQGSNDEIFSYWALNDVATALYIQAEAYRRADKKEEAKMTFSKIINEYSFGQCWDPKGWFWKPAEAAKEKVAMIESGVGVDLSDNSSNTLTTKAWEALAAKDVKAVDVYTDKILQLYEKEAKDMESSLKGYAWESKEKIFSYWALNDVGTALYIKGKAHEEAGEKDAAMAAYKKLVDEFKYAQCWDPGGWFWKPAEDAEKRLDNLAVK